MIKVCDRIRITRVDKLNLQLEVLQSVKSKNGVEKKWRKSGCYGDLRSALIGVVKKYTNLLVDDEVSDLKILLEKIENLYKIIEGAMQ